MRSEVSCSSASAPRPTSSPTGRSSRPSRSTIRTAAPSIIAAEGSQGWTLVYFYPKADTPGCTKQACSLRDSYASLTGKGIRVYGVSTDDEKSQKAFQEKYKLPFTLLADKDKKVVTAFGVPATMGFAKRQAFLFRDGVLVWKDLEAATSEQAAEVLAAIQEIEAGPGTQRRVSSSPETG